MNILFRTFSKKRLLSKKLWFSPKFYVSNDHNNFEIVEPEQEDEELLQRKVHRSYVFLEKSLALPIEFPLFPFSKFAISLGETRGKVIFFLFHFQKNYIQPFN